MTEENEVPEYTPQEYEEFQILTAMMTVRDRLMRLIGEERSPRARNIAITLTQLQLAIGNYHSWVLNGGLDATWLEAATGEEEKASAPES